MAKGDIDLTVVIPVYNEQEIISTVVESWISELSSHDIKYLLCIYNDGSTDGSLARLLAFEKKHSSVKVVDKPNSGHGCTILRGYREADSTWIFQVDSDNEMESRHFIGLWENRNGYDLVIGARKGRIEPLSRKVITFFSRLTIWVLYGTGIKDVDAPYRLYRADKFRWAFDSLPNDTFAPNVILSGYAIAKNLKIKELEIPCARRQTGTVSIKRMKLLRAAGKSWVQTVAFRFGSSFRGNSHST